MRLCPSRHRQCSQPDGKFAKNQPTRVLWKSAECGHEYPRVPGDGQRVVAPPSTPAIDGCGVLAEQVSEGALREPDQLELSLKVEPAASHQQ
jgi:hypothetical protein